MSTASPEVDVRPIEIVETESLTNTENTDGTKDDNLRHIVRPFDNDNPVFYEINRNPTAQDIVDIARVRGIEVTALCGKTWVPKHNTEGRDTCDTCIGMAGVIRNGG
jgi:hypothetical protein